MSIVSHPLDFGITGVPVMQMLVVFVFWPDALLSALGSATRNETCSLGTNHICQHGCVSLARYECAEREVIPEFQVKLWKRERAQGNSRS